MEPSLDLMMERFAHDDSPFAQQYFEKEGVKRKVGTHYFRVTKGVCNHDPKHLPKDCPDITSVIFNKGYLREHLGGRKTYAPYQTSADGKVKWLCIDVDAYDDADTTEVQKCVVALAKNVQSLIGSGYTLVEDSGSKGYHLWLFFSQPIDVGRAHVLGEMISADVPLPLNTNLEIYPKHIEHRENFFGATVKLPLGIHQKTQQRCQFVGPSFNPYEDQWQRLADTKLIPYEWVEEHVEKPTPIVRQTQSRPYVPLCLADMWEGGADEGLRDEVAFRTACYLRDKGLPEPMADAMMRTWNDLNHPPLDDYVLDRKVEQAYSTEYSWMPCHDHRFDRHCHSACKFFERKKERRWFKTTSPIGIISKD